MQGHGTDTIERLPRFVTRKNVRAAPIVRIERATGDSAGAVVVQLGGERHRVQVPTEFFGLGEPPPGAYLVVDTDGRLSWSSRKEFEASATRIRQLEPA
jgi:hypothetical protein